VDANSFYPIFFRLTDSGDVEQFETLIKKGVVKSDFLLLQLCELVQIMNPKRKLTKQEAESLAIHHVGTIPWDNYGCWVYYPWKNVVVHLLDEVEFCEVRTKRNRYKLTDLEQEYLSKKKIGIIGLSVGHSVAMAIAIQRIAGEIRIADFDTLDLSNLNRIRTSVLNLGFPKTVIVAREIAELDPFIRVVCFNEGITAENIDSFFDDNGRLDVLVEECDSVEIKILARSVAKAKRVPVVMETSDRGMIDIERYDIDPNYQLLHGLIDPSVDYNFLCRLKTAKEKLPYILPFAGVENISDRMAASALEIETSITSWPQLGAEVQLGGALAAVKCGQILLGMNVESGREYHDFGLGQIPDQVPQKNPIDEPEISVSDFEHLIRNKTGEDNADIYDELISDIIERSLVAPSPGNNQRWKFALKKSNVFLFIDKLYNGSVGDNLGYASILGLGALIENIELLANSYGLNVDLTILDESNFPLIARITFSTGSILDKFSADLVAEIPRRRTNRKVGANSPLLAEEKEALNNSVEHYDNCTFHSLYSKEEIRNIGTIIGIGDRIRIQNSQAHHEFFKREVRWSQEENSKFRNGIDIEHILLKPIDRIGLHIARRYGPVKFLKELNLGKTFEKISTEAIENSSALVCICTTSFGNEDLIEAGRSMQRYWLTASRLNIGIQPMSFVISLFSLLKRDENNFLNESEKNELNSLYSSFKKQFELTSHQIPVFLFRVHKVAFEPEKSLRVPISQKLVKL
jgi:molybdopterin/thiamine biosynthesis adenylyltransferase